MALVVADRVQETTSNAAGTSGSYTLDGAKDGFQSFAVVGDGNTTYYACTDGTDYEVGIGTYTASGTTLARTTIIESSNSNAAVNWSSTTTKDIFVTLPASKAVYEDSNNKVSFANDLDVTYGNVSFTGTQPDYSTTASGLFDSISSTNVDLYTNNRGHNSNLTPSTGYVAQLANRVYNLSVNSTGISFRLYGNVISQNANDQWSSTTDIHYSDVTLNWSGATVVTVSNAGTFTASSNLPGTTYLLGTSELDNAISAAAEAAGVSSNLYDWIPDEVTVTESSDVFRARIAGSSTDLDTYSFTQNSSTVYLYGHYVVAGRFLILSQYPNQNDAAFNDSSAAANPDTEITVARFDRSVQTQITPFGVVTTSNGNLNLDPNGSGKVVLKGNSTRGAGQFVLNCEQNTHGITIKGPPHSAGATYTLTLPDTDGNSSEFLQTDGSGNLSWATGTSYTHPNHTGEVTSTGDGATVIADDVVDEANLKVSNAPTDGYVLTARSGNTGGLTWEAASGGGGIALTDLSVTQNTASGSGTLSYDNTSGVFSYTPPVISGGGGSTASALTEQEFTATAGQTVFTVTGGITNANNVVVFLNGSRLFSTDVTVSDTANTVTLAAGATVGDLVTVSEFGAAFGSQYSSTIFTVGTSSEYNTSTKVLTTSYTANRVAVYLNGVKLLVGTDCTATNGTTIDLTNAAPVTGDKIEVVEHGTLADTVTTLTGLSDTPSSLGTAGQILQVNSGATALEFADASTGSGVTVYTGLSGTDGTPSGATYLLNASNPSAGDLAYVSSNTSLYQNNGNGWYRIAVINTTPTISSVADASSNTTPFTLEGGTNTVITVTASDADEGTDLTYSYSVTSGSLNGTTVTQGTGASENVFTITPHASNATTFSLTFTVSDSINAATSVAEFSLSFVSWAGATQEAKLTASDAQAGDVFGLATALSSDGNTVIVGAAAEDTGGTNAGAAYIFTRSGTTWSQEAKIQASDKQAGDSFGVSVSISSDGNTAIVAAYEEDAGGADAGAVYIFTRSGTTWSQEAKLTASDAEAADYFGAGVGLSSNGNTAIVGALYEDTGGTNAGAAYVFTRSGTTWSQEAKIQASDKQADDEFGRNVTISSDGNTAIVGAMREDAGGTDAGAAYVFTRSGTTWSQEAKLTASDAAGGDYFGRGLFISGDGNTAIVGAYQEDAGGTNAGAAYIFTRSGTTWSQEAKLTASDAQAGDSFGISVCVSSDGDVAIIGAYQEDTNGADAGAAYVFTRSGTTWSQQSKIQSSDIQAGDWFGMSVSISSDGSTAIVGARQEDAGGTDAGAAYIFVEG